MATPYHWEESDTIKQGSFTHTRHTSPSGTWYNPTDALIAVLLIKAQVLSMSPRREQLAPAVSIPQTAIPPRQWRLPFAQQARPPESDIGPIRRKVRHISCNHRLAVSPGTNPPLLSATHGGAN
ncbi:hypothetical protein MRX96_004990 [Rhipicephalus microplus]